MGIKSKIETAWWFAKQPSLYPQFLYQVRQKFFPHPKENTREESTDWCEMKAIESEEAIALITGESQAQDLKDLYPKNFEYAMRSLKGLPVTMGGGADMNLIYYLAEYTKAKNALETGVAHGWSSLAFLLSLKKRDGAMLFSSDMPYAKMNNEDFVGCVVDPSLKKRWKLLRRPDRQSIPMALNNMDYLDLCHYDSDKSYRGRMWAYPILWEKLRPGGIFISDDINDDLGFKDFSELIGVDPIVVRNTEENKFIGVLLKNT